MLNVRENTSQIVTKICFWLPSWTSSWQERRTAPSAPLCTARPPIQTNIWILSLTIQRHTRELLSRHCCTEPMPSLHQEWAGWRRRSMWPRPSRGMVIPLVSSADTPFQPSPAKYRTAVDGVHYWPSPTLVACWSPSAECCCHPPFHLRHYRYWCISVLSLLITPVFLFPCHSLLMNTCTSRDHFNVCLRSCIYTLVPVSVHYSLMKASVGGQNVWSKSSWLFG